MILILNVQWKILRYSCYHLVTSAKKSPDNSGLNNNKRLCSYLFLAAAFLGAAFLAVAMIF